jgi:hypothetical protein
MTNLRTTSLSLGQAARLDALGDVVISDSEHANVT